MLDGSSTKCYRSRTIQRYEINRPESTEFRTNKFRYTGPQNIENNKLLGVHLNLTLHSLIKLIYDVIFYFDAYRIVYEFNIDLCYM